MIQCAKACVLKKLAELQTKVPGEVQVAAPENGYACGLIDLLVLMVESFINRL